jgi:hypothetical protein
VQTTQKRILDMIAHALDERKITHTISYSHSNTGSIYLYAEQVAPVAFGKIRFNFQSCSFTMSIEIDGVGIPSQAGRADYFDFLQAYDEPTLFWRVLARELEHKGFQIKRTRKPRVSKAGIGVSAQA